MKAELILTVTKSESKMLVDALSVYEQHVNEVSQLAKSEDGILYYQRIIETIKRMQSEINNF